MQGKLLKNQKHLKTRTTLLEGRSNEMASSSCTPTSSSGDYDEEGSTSLLKSLPRCHLHNPEPGCRSDDSNRPSTTIPGLFFPPLRNPSLLHHFKTPLNINDIRCLSCRRAFHPFGTIGDRPRPPHKFGSSLSLKSLSLEKESEHLNKYTSSPSTNRSPLVQSCSIVSI